MESPALSRSGRVIKKSTKLKEMEDIDIADFDGNLKARKKSKGMDEFEELMDDKRIAPIKIPKLAVGSSPFPATSPKKKLGDCMPSPTKIPSIPSSVKPMKLDPNQSIFRESSPENRVSSSSESSSSSSSSSSSDDDSDIEINQRQPQHMVPSKSVVAQTIQHMPTPQEKVIVESYSQQFNSPLTFVDQNSELAMFGSEEETSESNLVIAEESSDSRDHVIKEKKGPIKKKSPKKSPIVKPPPIPKPKTPKKKPPAPPKEARPPARKKPEPAKEKKITAYMLWCSENRKRIVSQNPVLFSSISKKMSDIWQALPEKEKMTWRRKAKKLTQKKSTIISTGRPAPEPAPKPVNNTSIVEDNLTSSADGNRTIGTAPIDVAAYLKLLGESLSIIGQRLTEHEGQIAVSGIFSVLLDSTLCALGPLLCLTSEVKEINGCTQNTLGNVVDNIAYFMPGL